MTGNESLDILEELRIKLIESIIETTNYTYEFDSIKYGPNHIEQDPED